jgi:hypothetical protein
MPYPTCLGPEVLQVWEFWNNFIDFTDLASLVWKSQIQNAPKPKTFWVSCCYSKSLGFQITLDFWIWDTHSVLSQSEHLDEERGQGKYREGRHVWVEKRSKSLRSKVVGQRVRRQSRKLYHGRPKCGDWGRRTPIVCKGVIQRQPSSEALF